MVNLDMGKHTELNNEAQSKINRFISRMEELIFLNKYASSRDVTNKINSAFINILGIKPKNRLEE